MRRDFDKRKFRTDELVATASSEGVEIPPKDSQIYVKCD